MAKCRMLLQENEDLGKTVSSGRLAKLEGDIALQKKLIIEMKNSEKGSFGDDSKQETHQLVGPGKLQRH